MKKTAVKIIVVIVAVVFLFSAGFWTGFSADMLRKSIFNRSGTTVGDEEEQRSIIDNLSGSIKKKFSLTPLEEAMDFIFNDSINQVSREELLAAAISGMLSSLDDRHAEYFDAEQYGQIVDSYSGTMSGVGIIVTQDEEGSIVVVMPLPDTPAFDAGIMEGDIIVEVDGKDIKDIALENVVSMIKGQEGTHVELGLYRPSEKKQFKVDLVRARFYVPNLFSEVLDENIGYIQYLGFQDKGFEQLDAEIEKLMTQGIDGLVLDLRNNLGGVLDDAVGVCDLFLDKGAIVTVRGRTDNQERVNEYFAREGKYTDIPLVVIINGFSASASELVAGALKDNGRAVLVGETSFGKGTVQVVHELSDGSGLKFTTAKYFLPSGISIEGVGVEPDFEVILTAEDTTDLQLEKAKEEIRKMTGENVEQEKSQKDI